MTSHIHGRNTIAIL